MFYCYIVKQFIVYKMGGHVSLLNYVFVCVLSCKYTKDGKKLC